MKGVKFFLQKGDRTLNISTGSGFDSGVDAPWDEEDHRVTFSFLQCDLYFWKIIMKYNIKKYYDKPSRTDK